MLRHQYHLWASNVITKYCTHRKHTYPCVHAESWWEFSPQTFQLCLFDLCLISFCLHRWVLFALLRWRRNRVLSTLIESKEGRTVAMSFKTWHTVCLITGSLWICPSFLSTFLQCKWSLCWATVTSREKQILLTVFSAAELLELHCLCREAGFIIHPYMGRGITRRGTDIVLSGMKCNGVHRPTVSNVLHQNIPCVHTPYAWCWDSGSQKKQELMQNIKSTLQSLIVMFPDVAAWAWRVNAVLSGECNLLLLITHCHTNHHLHPFHFVLFKFKDLVAKQPPIEPFSHSKLQTPTVVIVVQTMTCPLLMAVVLLIFWTCIMFASNE